jgi:hypothetical protein
MDADIGNLVPCMDLRLISPVSRDRYAWLKKRKPKPPVIACGSNRRLAEGP